MHHFSGIVGLRREKLVPHRCNIMQKENGSTEIATKALLERAEDCFELAKSHHVQAESQHENASRQLMNADAQREIAVKQHFNADTLEKKAKSLQKLGNALEADASKNDEKI